MTIVTEYVHPTLKAYKGGPLYAYKIRGELYPFTQVFYRAEVKHMARRSGMYASGNPKEYKYTGRKWYV